MKKKIKVKVKKRKLNLKKILLFLLLLLFISLLIYWFCTRRIKNIYIIGNKLLSDKEIIELARIDDYPKILSVTENRIEKRLKRNSYIKDVKIDKTISGKIYIYITEKKILCTYNNDLIFNDASMIYNEFNITSYPILVSDVSNIMDKFVERFSLIDDTILLKISEIEYAPNEVDDERFILKMNDGNLVYITLKKIEKINKYNSIYSSLEGKRGIIYLDLGDFVEIKEE